MEIYEGTWPYSAEEVQRFHLAFIILSLKEKRGVSEKCQKNANVRTAFIYLVLP